MFIKNVACVNMRYNINLINGSFTYKYLISVMHPHAIEDREEWFYANPGRVRNV